MGFPLSPSVTDQQNTITYSILKAYDMCLGIDNDKIIVPIY